MSQENYVNIRKSIGFQDGFPNLHFLSDGVVHQHSFIFLLIHLFFWQLFMTTNVLGSGQHHDEAELTPVF